MLSFVYKDYLISTIVDQLGDYGYGMSIKTI